MVILVENLITGQSRQYNVGRVPCVGEAVVVNLFSDEEQSFEVRSVVHILDPAPATGGTPCEVDLAAIVRVR